MNLNMAPQLPTSFIRPDAFAAAMRAHLQSQFEAEADRIADAAAAEYRKAVRAKMGAAIVAMVEECVMVERFGRELRITVRYIEGDHRG